MNIVSRAIFRVVAVLAVVVGILNLIDAIYASATTSAATENLSMSATIGESVTVELSNATFELEPTPSSEGDFVSTADLTKPFKLNIYTNSSSGFTIGMTTSETSLKSGSNSIATLDSSYATNGVSKDAFPIDKWGYSVGGATAKYYPVAANNIIDSYDRLNANSQNGIEVQVNFGVKLSLETAPGAYTGTLNFTATAVSGGGHLEAIDDGNSTTWARVCTVNWNAGEGTVLPSSSVYYCGGKFGTLPTPILSGYNFAGWYTAAGGTGTQIMPDSTVSSDATYYAKWEIAALYMQDVGSWKDQLSIGDSIQAVDSRDDKTYWVTKLADGNIWMTQNLDLDITTAGLSASDTDITSDWNSSSTYKPVATLTDASQYKNESSTSTDSWDAGDWYYDGTTVSICDSGGTTYANCTGFSSTGDAHRHVGNMYSWNAATAGTGGTITSGQAEGSICPKGWRLPTGGSSGEFQALASALGGPGTSTVQNWLNPPYYFTRTGSLWYDSAKLYDAGFDGNYWSSTPYSYSSDAYGLYFGGSSSVYPATNNNRAVGLSVRCVADS